MLFLNYFFVPLQPKGFEIFNFGRNFHNNNYGALNVANSWSNQAAARRRQEMLARARKPSECN